MSKRPLDILDQVLNREPVIVSLKGDRELRGVLQGALGQLQPQHPSCSYSPQQHPNCSSRLLPPLDSCPSHSS